MEQHESFLRRPAHLGRDRLHHLLSRSSGARVWAAITGDARQARRPTSRPNWTRRRGCGARPKRCCATPTAQREAALRDAQAMLEHAKAEAAQVAESARAEAAAAASRRERMALDRIGAAEKAAVTDVRLAAADIASRAAEQVHRAGLRRRTQDAALIDRAIQGLPARACRAAAPPNTVSLMRLAKGGPRAALSACGDAVLL